MRAGCELRGARQHEALAWCWACRHVEERSSDEERTGRREFKRDLCGREILGASSNTWQLTCLYLSTQGQGGLARVLIGVGICVGCRNEIENRMSSST